MPLPRSLRSDALHLLTLCAFAVAQPLYSVLGRNAEFLVAHHADRRTIVSLVLVLSAAVPAVLVMLELMASLAGTRVRHHVHTVLVTCLSILFFGAMVARTVLPAPVAIGAAIVAAVAAALAYRRLPLFRTFLTVVSPAGLIFPIVFLFTGPVARLVFPPAVPAQGLAVAPDSPVVLVVFDELSTFGLLDGDGRIDVTRFPSFASLAGDAWWFPNAMASASYTEKALPAIVTGRMPAGEVLQVPVAADYPRSLFTWLGGAYAMHVSEPLTALCPPAVCVPGEDEALEPDVRVLYADLLIIYTHVVAPRGLARRLVPPVFSAWKGFGRTPADVTKWIAPVVAGPREWKIGQQFDRSIEKGRAELFRQFVAGVSDGARPALHFVHVSLPHQPYQYLPSGHSYVGGAHPAEGLGDDDIWTSDEALVVTGERQYEQQVEFADRLLGELLERLRSTGVYDRALVLVTSDHGAAFVPGESHRSRVTRVNFRDIAAVPLLVKLPYQQEARIDERPAEGIDILPTIAAVLGTHLPWEVEGHSVLDTAPPQRFVLPYKDSEGAPLAPFDVRSEARRDWRRQRLARVLGKDPPPLSSLAGESVAGLSVTPSALRLQVISDNFVSFRNVDPGSGFVPALVRGRIEGEGTESLQIAIAINGVVRAVTRTASWQSAARYFAVLLPDEVLQAGNNTLEVFVLNAASGGATTFTPIPAGFGGSLEIESEGTGRRLAGADGSRIPFEPGIEGWLDRVEISATTARLHGWAADRTGARGVRAVVAFAGGAMIGTAVPYGPRADVATALGMPAATRTAFMIELPVVRLRGPIKLIAISDGHFAGELLVNPEAAATLRRFQ